MVDELTRALERGARGIRPQRLSAVSSRGWGSLGLEGQQLEGPPEWRLSRCLSVRKAEEKHPQRVGGTEDPSLCVERWKHSSCGTCVHLGARPAHCEHPESHPPERRAWGPLRPSNLESS